MTRTIKKLARIFSVGTIVIILGFFVVSFFAFQKVQAANQANITAYVVNKKGESLPDGEYDVRFAVYSKDRATIDPYPSNSDSGVKVWQEEQKITIFGGVMSAYIGEKVPFPADLNFSSDDYYLGVRIGTDSEMAPRKKLGAAFSAINSSFLQGKTIGNEAGNIPLIGSNGSLDPTILAKINEVGTISSGTWEGDLITDEFIASDLTDKTYNGINLITTTGVHDLTISTNAIIDQNISTTSDVTFNSLALTTALMPTNGGTGISTYAIGDILYASSTTELAKLAIGADGQALTIVGGVPTWGEISTTSNLLSSSHLDTTAGLPVRGDIITAQGVAPTWNKLAIGTFGQVLKSDGTDAYWGTDLDTDTTYTAGGTLLNLSGTTFSINEGALTSGYLCTFDGTNLACNTDPGSVGHALVTLAGTPDYLTLSGQQITLGQIDLTTDVTGTLPVANGGTGISSYTSGDMLYYSSGTALSKLAKGNSGQVLVMGTDYPSWVSAATPTAHALLSIYHSDITAGAVARGALITGQGVTPSWSSLALGTNGYFLKSDGTDVAWAQPTKSDVGLSNVENTTLSTWAGTSNITTLGTITTGTWNGSTVDTSHGGTGTGTAFTSGSVVFAGDSGVYSQDNSNFFWDSGNHRLGIGTTSPTAYLNIKAGTATANTAPLKFTSGTNLTAAEAGAVEWDGTSLYITQTSGPTRKTIAYIDSALTGTFDGINLATGTQGGVGYFSSTTQLSSSVAGTSGQALISGATGSPTWYTPTAGSVLFAGTSGILQQNNANLFWDNTNARLGIGTTSPTSILHTVASGAKTVAYTGNLLTNTATSSTASIIKTGLDVQSTGTWNGTTATNIGLNVNATGGTTNYAALFNGGNVGIGTAAPANKLDVNGSVTISNVADANGNLRFSAANPVIYASSYFTAPGGAYFSSGTVYAEAAIQARGGIHNDTGTYLTISGGTSGHTYFSGAGNVGIGTAAPGSRLEIKGAGATSATSALNITNSTPTSLLYVRNDGNIGIGTTNPAAALHIGQTAPTNLNSVANSLMVSGGLEVAGSAYLGPMQFPQNSGAITWIDMPVAASVAAGTAESYTAAVGGTGILTVYGKALGSGAGGIQSGTGRVGIGTTTPGAKLQIGSGTPNWGTDNELWLVSSSQSSIFRAGQDSSHAVSLGWTYNATAANASASLSTFGNNTNPLYIDAKNVILQNTSIGKVGIGIADPLTKLSVLETTSGSARGIFSTQLSSNTSGAKIGFDKARGTSSGYLTVNSGDTLGNLVFRGFDGSDFLEMAAIEAGVSGTVASNRIPTYLAFSTATDASPSVLTERMRIDNAGYVGIGDTTPAALFTVGNGDLFQVSSAGAITAPTSTNTINNLIINAGALSGITTLSMNNQLTSTLADGTAPFSITSTTVNTNLNADLLDGIHAAAFQTALTNPVTGTGTNGYVAYWNGTNTLTSEQYLSTSRGGTGLSSTPTNGQLLIGNGSGYTLANLTAGDGISITNGSGTISIASAVSGYVNDPTGFPNRTDTTLSFSNSLDPAPTFTITGTNYKVYIKGHEYTKSTESVDITDTDGIWYIYYNSSGNLTASQIPWAFSDAQVAVIYWNSSLSVGYLSDERHGISMDWSTHEYLHDTVGTRYESGFGISGYTLNTQSDAGVTFGVGSGVISDEDLEISIAHSDSPSNPFEQILNDPAQIPVFYRVGANGIWQKDTATDYAFKNTASGRVNYNQYTGGSWQQTQATNTNFVAYWIVATTHVNEPVISIQGQREDTSLANAQTNNAWENMQLGSLPVKESKLLFRVILKTANASGGTRKAEIVQVTDYRNSSSLPSTAFLASDHGALSGLSDDDHFQYALLAGRSGGQTLIGGTEANNILTIQGNSASGNTATNANLQFNVGDAGGTNAITILNNGNVGIGTTTPSHKLTVAGSDADVMVGDAFSYTPSANLDFVVGSASQNSRFLFGQGNSYYGGMQWNYNATPANAFLSVGVMNGTNTNGLNILQSGNVGIGTTTPSQKLDIRKTSNGVVNYNLYLANEGTGNGTGVGIEMVAMNSTPALRDQALISSAWIDNTAGSEDSYLAFSTRLAGSVGEKLRIDNNGNVGVGTTSPTYKLQLTGASPLLALERNENSTHKNLFDFKINNHNLEINPRSQAGNVVFFASADAGVQTGNVGIGTTNPNSKLYVAGPSQDASTYGIMNFDNNTGTNDVGVKFGAIAGAGTAGYAFIQAKHVGYANDGNIAINPLGGNVGIGTTAPLYLLDVKGNARINSDDTATFKVNSNGAVGVARSFIQLTRGLSPTENGWDLSSNLSQANDEFTIRSIVNSVASTPLTILKTGNVGIGTTNPAYTLQLYNATKSYFAIYTAASKNTAFAFQQGSGNGTTGNNSFFMGIDGNASDNNFGYGGGTNDVLMATYYGSAFRNLLRFPIGTQNAIFYGNVGIGTTAPTAVLHLKAGTATAGTAPLKFTTGTNLSTAEAGAMEYDGSELYFTPTGTTRETIAYISDITSATHNALTLGAIGSTPNANGMTLSTQQLNLQPADGTFGGVVSTTTQTFAGAKTFSNLITGSAGLTITGAAINLNDSSDFAVNIATGSSSGAITIGGGSNTLSINTSDWDISTTGVMTGISGITNDAGYTQSGINANTFTGTTTFSNGTYSALFTGGGVGIATTAPGYALQVGDASNAANVYIAKGYLCVDDDGTCGAGSPAAGTVYAVNAYTTGADYAEYFYTKDTNLKSGEAVCVDTEKDNAVKRCQNDGDNNIMGIVSTKPSIVGNQSSEQKNDPDHYKIIGMIGQVSGFVSSENGKIEVGDSLTASVTPGYMRKANAGESTVGVAMQNFNGVKGTIQVLISRRNQSLTVEKVEEEVTQNIASMNIQDKVNALVKKAETNLDNQISNLYASQQNQANLIGSEIAAIKAMQTKLSDQVDLIEEQAKTASDFILSLNVTDIIYKNTLGNINLLGGKITAMDIEATNSVKAKDIEATDNLKVENLELGNDISGSGKIEEGQLESDPILTKQVTAKTKIYITPKNSTEGKTLYYDENDIKDGESFTVKIDAVLKKDIEFNWLIIK